MNFDPSFLLNYGVLGAWTIYLLYRENIADKEMVNALNDLKDAIEKINK